MGFKLSDKVKGVIAAIAPTLGTALGGPLGGLAGNILASQLGGDEASAEKAILTQDPETLLKIKQAESDFKVKLRELDISEEDIHAKDRQSARDLAKVDMGPQKLLSLVFIGGYFIIVALLLVSDITINPGMKETFILLIGVVTGNVPAIMQFWFGSSTGSKEKTAGLINK